MKPALKHRKARDYGYVLPQSTSALALIALAIFIVFGQLLATGHRWVEYPLFYMMNPEFSNQDWINAYNPFREGGYRPTAFNLYFKIVTGLFGWQNFHIYQWIAFLFQFLLGTSAWLFARKALKFDSMGSFFTGLMVAIHPVFFMLPVHLIHFDAIYEITLILASILWISKPRFSPLTSITFLCLSLFALTSKEQAVALPCFLIWVSAYDHFKERSIRRSLFSAKYFCLLLVFTAAGLIFVSRILYSPDGGSTYRVAMDIPIILKNFLAGIFWVFRLHFFDAPTWPYVRELLHPAGALLGCLLVFFAIVYIKEAIQSPKGQRNLWIISGLIVTFFLLPVYSGGRQWHFGIPAIGTMLLSAGGISILLSSTRLSFTSLKWLEGGLIVLLVACSTFELNRDQFRRGSATTRILRQALEFPPVETGQLPQNANILYECNDVGNLWAFHSLFNYVYQRRDLNEHVVLDLSDLDHGTLHEISDIDKLRIFDFKAHRQPSWLDITSTALPMVLQQIEESHSGAIAFIDLREDASPCCTSQSGWSIPERKGRWTDGEKAGLKVELPSGVKEDVVCCIRMAGYVNKRHPSMQVQLYIDGIQTDHLEIKHPQGSQAKEYRIAVPQGALNDGSIDIEFQIDSPARPIDITRSKDQRSLGLFVEYIELFAEESPLPEIDS